MSETNYPGVDYSSGTANFDKATGIHYGVICVHDLSGWALGDFEADYGDPTCPNCGGEVKDSTEVGEEEIKEHEDEVRDDGCQDPLPEPTKDYYCLSCAKSYWSDEVYGDMPCGHVLDDGEYKAVLDEYNDVFILKSPYYTHAQFCSPCAPGAGHLGHPCTDGPKTFCFGHDWFEKGIAPYLVYKVTDGELVPAPTQKESQT